MLALIVQMLESMVQAGINSADGRINIINCRMIVVNVRIIGEDTGNSPADGEIITEGFQINTEDSDKK